MASDIWQGITQTVREETCCRHMGYSFQLAARVLLYESSHRQDKTYHDLCYTSRGALAGTRNSSAGTPRGWICHLRFSVLQNNDNSNSSGNNNNNNMWKSTPMSTTDGLIAVANWRKLRIFDYTSERAMLTKYCYIAPDLFQWHVITTCHGRG